MKTRIELITPEAAQKYLSRNTHNYRPVRQHVVAAYADDMKSGKWERNGEAIVFDRDGVLKDGQHRLMAIAQSGLPQTMVIVEDVEPDVEIYDIGVKRSSGQIAMASGVEPVLANSTVIAAARVFCDGGTFTKQRTRSNPQGSISMIKSHEDLFMNAVSLTKSGSNRTNVTRKRPCIVANIVLLREEIATFQTLKDFAMTLNTGVPHGVRTENSAPLILRRMMLESLGTRGVNGEIVSYSAYVDALHDYVHGIKRRIAYRVNEANLELLKTEAAKMCDERAKYMEDK